MEKNLKGSFFNHDAYEYLFSQVFAGKDKDDQDALDSAFKSFVDYVNGVDHAELASKVAYANLEGDELQFRIKDLDEFRHHRHETAVANARLVNRLAAIYSTTKVFTGDENDRLQVADFCLEVATYLFNNRKK